MSNSANASVEVIERFRGQNNDFLMNIGSFRSTFNSAISGLTSLCDSKLREYNSMLSEAESLLTKAHSKQSKLMAQVSACSSRLSSTPKTVKETYTDSQGNKHTRERSNPAYGAAQAALQNAKNAAAAADRIVADVARFKEHVRNQCSAIDSMGKNLESLNSDVQRTIENLERMAESAGNGLERALGALTDYIDYTIG